VIWFSVCVTLVVNAVTSDFGLKVKILVSTAPTLFYKVTTFAFSSVITFSLLLTLVDSAGIPLISVYI